MKTINDWIFLATVDPHRRKFHHPQTGHWVLFESLPPETQAHYKQQYQLQQSQPQGEHAIVNDVLGDLGGEHVDSEPGDGGIVEFGEGDGGGGDFGGDSGGDGGAIATKGPIPGDQGDLGEDGLLPRGENNTGEVQFGEALAGAGGEVYGRLGDYMGMELEDLLDGSKDLGTRARLDSQGEPDTNVGGGDHLGHGQTPGMDAWSFLKDQDKESSMERSLLAPAMEQLFSVNGEPPAEPPPPAQIRRVLQDRMRDLGRTLVISGSKPPRVQMVEIQKVLTGLMEQLELLADQPGREALRRRILLQMRPHIMKF